MSVWLLLVAADLVVLAGLFSAADAALSTFSRARAEELLDDARPGAKRLVALLEDLPRLRAMRIAARASAESLDWEGIVQGIEQVHASAIDGTSVALRAGSQLSGIEARAH